MRLRGIIRAGRRQSGGGNENRSGKNRGAGRLSSGKQQPLSGRKKEVEGWTRGELEYARYEIFARRGMLFDDPEIAEYFSGKSWYFGFIKSDFPESMLNEYELANAELLERLAAEAEDDTEESGTEEDQKRGGSGWHSDTAKTDDADDTQSGTGEAGADEAGEAVTEEETGDAAKPARDGCGRAGY